MLCSSHWGWLALPPRWAVSSQPLSIPAVFSSSSAIEFTPLLSSDLRLVGTLAEYFPDVFVSLGGRADPKDRTLCCGFWAAPLHRAGLRFELLRGVCGQLSASPRIQGRRKKKKKIIANRVLHLGTWAYLIKCVALVKLGGQEDSSWGPNVTGGVVTRWSNRQNGTLDGRADSLKQNGSWQWHRCRASSLQSASAGLVRFHERLHFFMPPNNLQPQIFRSRQQGIAAFYTPSGN